MMSLKFLSYVVTRQVFSLLWFRIQLELARVSYSLCGCPKVSLSCATAGFDFRHYCDLHNGRVVSNADSSTQSSEVSFPSAAEV